MPPSPGPGSTTPAILELEQLQLRYPGTDHWTLNGLNLRIAPGEHLALVGPSGWELGLACHGLPNLQSLLAIACDACCVASCDCLVLVVSAT